MDKAISLVELELARVNWSELREIRSCLNERIISSDYVPVAVKELLNSKSIEEAETAYWKIDNHVVVQGQLFEAAEYLVPVLIASLLEIQKDFIKYSIFDLLIQIVAGTPDQSEIALGNFQLGERCRVKAREGLWILYKELFDKKSDGAFEILKLIETDASRIETFLKIKKSII